jgi:S1-C subfamily serine protease
VDGVIIRKVYRGSAAEAAGLRGSRQLNTGEVILGDVIIGLDGQPVGTIDDLKDVLDQLKVGDRVSVEFVRDDVKKQATVVLQQVN